MLAEGTQARGSLVRAEVFEQKLVEHGALSSWRLAPYFVDGAPMCISIYIYIYTYTDWLAIWPSHIISYDTRCRRDPCKRCR